MTYALLVAGAVKLMENQTWGEITALFFAISKVSTASVCLP